MNWIKACIARSLCHSWAVLVPIVTAAVTLLTFSSLFSASSVAYLICLCDSHIVFSLSHVVCFAIILLSKIEVCNAINSLASLITVIPFCNRQHVIMPWLYSVGLQSDLPGYFVDLALSSCCGFVASSGCTVLETASVHWWWNISLPCRKNCHSWWRCQTAILHHALTTKILALQHHT